MFGLEFTGTMSNDCVTMEDELEVNADGNFISGKEGLRDESEEVTNEIGLFVQGLAGTSCFWDVGGVVLGSLNHWDPVVGFLVGWVIKPTGFDGRSLLDWGRPFNMWLGGLEIK